MESIVHFSCHTYSYTGPAYGLQTKLTAEVDVTNVLIIKYFFRGAGRYDLSGIEDVGMVTDSQHFADIVVGDQDPDIAIAEVLDNVLDIDDRDRVDAGKRFIKQDEAWIRGEGARNLDAAAFSAGETDTGLIDEVTDMQFMQ